MTKIFLDLNNPQFQKDLFSLTKQNQITILNTLKKLSQMTWNQVYRDKGLKWEKIISLNGPHGKPIYSIRLGKGFRAVVFREDSWMRFLTLHPDHDSAYH